MKAFMITIFSTIKVFLVFSICTLFFYYGLMWLNSEYENHHRYDEPKGRAVKVFKSFQAEHDPDWLKRLLLFYELGE